MLLCQQKAHKGIKRGNEYMDVVWRKITLFILAQYLTDVFKAEVLIAKVFIKAVKPLPSYLARMLGQIPIVADKFDVLWYVFFIITAHNRK